MSDKIFQIKTLQDIFNLPTIEQISACLDEIKISMIKARRVSDQFKNAIGILGVDCESIVSWPETTHWVDDGKGAIEIKFKFPDGQSATVLKTSARKSHE